MPPWSILPWTLSKWTVTPSPSTASGPEKLNSPARKIAYLFLKEYASAMPELAHDDIAANEWIFEQMERIGVFQP
jgi:hypothetical protein